MLVGGPKNILARTDSSSVGISRPRLSEKRFHFDAARPPAKSFFSLPEKSELFQLELPCYDPQKFMVLNTQSSKRGFSKRGT